jgi:hypothetical protein
MHGKATTTMLKLAPTGDAGVQNAATLLQSSPLTRDGQILKHWLV